MSIGAIKISMMGIMIGLLGVLGLPALNMADDDDSRDGDRFEAKLNGYNAVPAVSTTGSGKFTAKISRDQNRIEYKLSYKNLVGTVVAASHIHLGQPDVIGGPIVNLCGHAHQPCPVSGKVTGTIFASDVTGPAGQGIDPGEFDKLLRAMRKGVTYVNLHTDFIPSGEIRGNIKED